MSAIERAPVPASPLYFLMSLTFVNWLGFAAWQALYNNFTLEQAGFSWSETGLTQTVREIPGFLAFTAIFFIRFLREQTFAYISLIVMCIGVAITGFFPTLGGILMTTTLMSLGYHYMETMQQSLSLQLLPKADAPRLMGRIAGAVAVAQFIAYGGLAILWWLGFHNYRTLYLGIGAIAIALTLLSIVMFKRFDGAVPQRKHIVLRSRYWLYYALTMMSGARRQIFTAFAGFLLVKKFGFDVTEIALLMLATATLNTVAAPILGKLIGRVGERATITFENIVLILVFIGYAMTNNPSVAAGLYVVDGVFFTLAIAQRTYFQKIGDPADMAPTAAVAFTINHIAAVVIPVTFGVIGMRDPALIFWLGAGIATTSLTLSFFVPRHPEQGRETTLRERALAAAE